MERKNIPIPYSGKTAREKSKTTKTYPEGYFKDKNCKLCKTLFTPAFPSERYCSAPCKNEALADNYLQRNYGISITNYRDLYESQDGKCKICGEDGLKRASSANSTVGLTVDHSHTSGEVRGLLCHTCNSALGQFKDSEKLLLNAIDYITAKPPEMDKPAVTTRLRVNDLSADKHLDILTDKLDNGLNRKELTNKYNITEAKVRGVVELKTVQSKEAYKRYCLLKESATTIENPVTELVEYT